MLKTLALLTTALVAPFALAPAALAADLPRKSAPMAPVALPVFSWTGFYVGGHAGYSFTGSDRISTAGNNAVTISNVQANFRPANLRAERDGFIGGAQAGYNYQIGNVVLGVEADISYVDTARATTFISVRGDQSTFRQDLDYLGTVRGRLGVAFDRLLIYGTGGLAYGNVKQRADFFQFGSGALQFQGARDKTETGYAAGGGVEYALPVDSFLNLFRSSAVTLRAEYLYYNLGKRNLQVGGVAGQPGITPANISGYASTIETDGHVARAGINFKFGT